MEEEIDFSQNNYRVSEMIEQAGSGDVAGLARSVREGTQIGVNDAMIWAFISVLFVRAFADLIRRLGDAGRPMVEVAAEKWRDSDDGYEPTKTVRVPK